MVSLGFERLGWLFDGVNVGMNWAARMAFAV